MRIHWKPIAIAVAAIALACSPTGPRSDHPEEIGEASLTLSSLPPDVHCVRITAFGNNGLSVTRLIGAVGTQILSGLSLGPDTFLGQAFNAPCDSFADASAPTWVTDPVAATVLPPPAAPAAVVLSFHPNGRGSVSIGFDAGSTADGVPGLPPNTSQCDSSGCICLPGFADCDGMLVNGCEVNLGSDASNCGSCGNECVGNAATCGGGSCQCPTQLCNGACTGASCSTSGKIMVVSGFDSNGNPLNSAEIYDGATGTWASTANNIPPPAGQGLCFPGVAALADGKVLVAGGGCSDGGFVTNKTYLWDASTNLWTQTGSMAFGRSNFMLKDLLDGTAIAVGGCAGGCSGPNALGQFASQVDPTSEVFSGSTWMSSGHLTTGRAGLWQAGVSLPDDRVMVCGGNDAFSTTFQSCEIWMAGTWTALSASLPHPDSPPLVLSGTGGGTKVLVVSSDGTQSLVYDPATGAAGAFTSPAPIQPAQVSGAVVALGDGRVLLAGGLSGNTVVATTQIYLPASNSWSPTAPMSIPRFGAAAALLRDGRVLVAGGRTLAASNHAVASAEVFDPATQTWSAVGTMATARSTARAVTLH